MESTKLKVGYLCLLIASASKAFANDAPVILTSGGAQALDSAAILKVRMASETVKMLLNKTSYVVDATFEFKNDGETIDIGVGFPKNGRGYLDDRFQHTVDFIKYETWVNGVATPFIEKGNTSSIQGYGTLPELMEVIRKIEPGKAPQGTFIAVDKRWLVKIVRFKGKATTTTRVRYEAPYLDAFPCEGCASYIYGTGKYWSGNIGKSTFIADLTGIPKSERPPLGEVFYFGKNDSKRVKRRTLTDGIEEAVLHDFKPENEEDAVSVCFGGCPGW